MVVTQDFRLGLTWKKICDDGGLYENKSVVTKSFQEKKTKFMKILLMKWLIEEFKFGMK